VVAVAPVVREHRDRVQRQAEQVFNFHQHLEILLLLHLELDQQEDLVEQDLQVLQRQMGLIPLAVSGLLVVVDLVEIILEVVQPQELVVMDHRLELHLLVQEVDLLRQEMDLLQ